MVSMDAAAEPADAVRRARREAVGVAVATSAYGVSFGALAVASGLDVWQTCVLSLLMFTGDRSSRSSA
jgi:predicted branched-subunit amino acid permease